MPWGVPILRHSGVALSSLMIQSTGSPSWYFLTMNSSRSWFFAFRSSPGRADHQIGLVIRENRF